MLTPEAIEASAKALYDLEPWQIASYSNDTYAWKALTPSDRSNYYRTATAALTAAAPLMEAQAKAEALREVESAVEDALQDAPPSNYEEDNYDAGYIAGLTYAQDLLRARAETIEGKNE